MAIVPVPDMGRGNESRSSASKASTSGVEAAMRK